MVACAGVRCAVLTVRACRFLGGNAVTTANLVHSRHSQCFRTLLPPHSPASCPLVLFCCCAAALTLPLQSHLTGMRTCFCTPQELQLLRSLLLRNSRRMQSTPWQQKHLNLGPNSPWIASFIAPVYPENLGDSKTLFDALTPEVLANLPRPTGNLGVRPGAGGGAAGRRGGSSSNSSGGAGAASRAASGSAGASSSSGSAGAAGGERSCRVCGATAAAGVKLQRCSRCKSTADMYCGSSCQKSDWSRHKKGCKPV